MLAVMEEMGVEVEKHHHEVAPSQHELGMKFGTLIETADSLQTYKYVVHQVAALMGKQLHLCQNLWQAIMDRACTYISQFGKTTNRCLQDLNMRICLRLACYIGGIIKHARAINALVIQ